MFTAIFRFFFDHPPVAFSRGELVLLAGASRWLLALALIAALALPAWQLWRRFGHLRRHALVVAALQAAMLVLVVLLLWRPALVVTTVVPRQNIAAVLLDDSASMALEQPRRIEQMKTAFAAATPLVSRLNERFQVRFYRFSDRASRIPNTETLSASGKTSDVDGALREVLSELRGLPLGAVLVVSDGAHNGPARARLASSAPAGAVTPVSAPGSTSGDALNELKARRVPLYAVGVGREHLDRDLQVDEVFVSSTIPAGGSASASVAITQEGYEGKTVNLEVRENGILIQTQPVSFDRPSQTVAARVNFTPRSPGVKEYTFALAPLPDEAISGNNTVSRAIVVDERKAKLLYIEGEPRWEYKFVRRALADDPTLQLTSLLRTSTNKFYRQGVENEKVLETGFPGEDELFGFEGLLVGSIEAGFFSTQELQSVYDFVSRRGGGLLMLAGRRSLSDGGYQNTVFADLSPVALPSATSGTFQRREARAEPTAQGLDSPLLQIAADPRGNSARWKEMPALGDYQRTGEPKAGAVVLARAVVSGERASFPLLVSQRFGRGRTMLFATASSWRWQMEQDHKDDTHERFWRQLLRGLVSDTPPPVRIATDKPLYRDDEYVELRAEVRDKKFQPVESAVVTATITAPDGSRREIPMAWSGREEGVFTAAVPVQGTGMFAAEVVARSGDAAPAASTREGRAGSPSADGPEGEIGRHATYFLRNEGSLEFYNARQNRALLESMARETGGAYYALDKASNLPEEMSYSQGGITERNAHDLWSLPAVLLLLFGLKGTEWGLRRYWGSV